MSQFLRRSLASAGLLGALALVLAMSGIASAASGSKAEHGTVHFAITHTIGKINFSAGDTTDSLFGPGAVVYQIHVLPSTGGKFTINIPKVTVFYKTGSATGTATATLTITNTKTDAATITGGVLKLTKGAGTHAGHTFTGTFSGTGSVSSGLYTINYKGTYK